MNKEIPENATILVWDATFYLTVDGKDVVDENGQVRIFNAPDLDWSHIAEYPDLEDLVEVT